jgi:ribonuclease P/MRP protein subunit POP7
LTEIAKRETQSLSSLSKRTHLQANGRLDPKQVERGIVEGVAEGARVGVGAEEVFVKGSGKAIERALEIGVYFQKEADCRVRVSIGSVRAIDDIELGVREKEEDKAEADDVGESGEAMDVDRGNGGKKDNAKGQRRKAMRDEDVPETRIRTLSVVTVAISLR